MHLLSLLHWQADSLSLHQLGKMDGEDDKDSSVHDRQVEEHSISGNVHELNICFKDKMRDFTWGQKI